MKNDNERKIASEKLLSELNLKGAIKHYSYSESNILFYMKQKMKSYVV